MKARLIMAVSVLLLASCGRADLAGHDGESAGDQDTSGQIIVLSDDLQALMDDFNAHVGKVRLVFLNGPTCGICLRGMADLNDAFLADNQDDDRLATFVVHVPTMGAKEKHAVDSIPLLSGPRIRHYWEETGVIGQLYAEVMDVRAYVWDFWAIYGPDVVWDGRLPPEPAYFEHQLGSTIGRSRVFPNELRLDAGRFANETLDRVAALDDRDVNIADDVISRDTERYADGTVIPHVGQPRSLMVRQHIIGRGGYANLKRIQSIEMRGTIDAQGVRGTLRIIASRPNLLERVIDVGGNASTARRASDGSVILDPGDERGIPADLEKLLLFAFEFDGLFVEFPEKGHEVSKAGMQKVADVLAWKLHMVQASGTAWYHYLNSHTGDIVRSEILDGQGNPVWVISRSDFRETSGFRFPHRIEYARGDGQAVATEAFDEIRVDMETGVSSARAGN